MAFLLNNPSILPDGVLPLTSGQSQMTRKDWFVNLAAAIWKTTITESNPAATGGAVISASSRALTHGEAVHPVNAQTVASGGAVISASSTT